jgi:uncharacterized protein with NRDE domain
MCLLLFAWQAHPRHRLVVAANRDEVYERPAAPLSPWDDAPDVLAGRDLRAGGTWMGLTCDGRWAALTNVRDPLNPRPATRSRGALVADYLTGPGSAAETAAHVHRQRDAYDGFNLVLADAEAAWAVSTRADAPDRLAPGVYGLSNDRLDTPWPKVERGKAALADALGEGSVDPDRLLALLRDDAVPPDDALPDTGVGLEWERRLGSVFIATEDYGTRVSTALVLNADGSGVVAERTWLPGGVEGETRRETLSAARTRWGG